VDSIGEGEKHVDAAAQNLGLEPGLTMKRDEARLDRTLRRPHLLYDSNLIVRDVAKDIPQSQNQ
jgi:hypothetical protein